MTESEWLDEIRYRESEAFRKLLTLSISIANKESGFTTAKQVADFIRRLNDKICSSVGDCPNE